MMLKCCVCGKEDKEVSTFPTELNKNKTNSYCLTCISSGFEPYEDLVNFGWEFGFFTKSYQTKIILPTLARNNKTIKHFNEDVASKKLLALEVTSTTE